MSRLIIIATLAALLSACASVPPYTPTSTAIGEDVIPNVLPSPTGKDQWVLLEISISPVDGKLVSYKAVSKPNQIACVDELEWHTTNQSGAVRAPAKFRICRLFDKDGKAIDEVKVDPLGKPLDKNADTEQPDAPKQAS